MQKIKAVQAKCLQAGRVFASAAAKAGEVKNMSIWKSMIHRFSREEISTWTSLKKTAYILLPLLIYLVAHDLAEILLWAGLEGVMSTFGEDLSAFLTAHAYTVQGVVNGLAMLLGLLVIAKAVKAEVSFERSTVVETAGAYTFLCVFAFLVAVGVNILFYQLGITGSSESFGKVQEAQFGVQLVTGLFLFGVISPIVEEAVFRGIIYNRLKRSFSVPVALVISALLFGFYHGNAVQAVYGTILGFLIAYIYEMFRSFRAPVVFHSVANISVFVMTYYKGLNHLSKPAAIGLAALMLAGAAGILVYLKKSFEK